MQHRTLRIITSVGVISAAVVLIGIQLSQYAVDATLRHWYSGASGYQEALALQKSTAKPIALFFHTEWCQNCKRLRETVLATPEVERFLKNAIAVKINPESGLKERQIADNYGVRGYPTFLLVDGRRHTVTRIRTGRNLSPQQFIDQCKQSI